MMPRRLQKSLARCLLTQQRTMTYATKASASKKAPPATHAHVKGSPFASLHGEKTIGWHLSHKTRELPYANTLRSNAQRLTFSNALLKKHAEALASGLLELGLRPGDTLGVIQENNIDQVVLQLACAKVGAIMVRFTPGNAKELDRFINLYRFRMLVTPTRIGSTEYLNKMFPEVMPELTQTPRDGVAFRAQRYPFLRQLLMSDPGVPVVDHKFGVVPLHDVLLYGPFGYYENPLRRISMHIKPDMPALVLADQVPLDTIDGANVPVYTQNNLVATGQLVADKVGLVQGDRVVLAADFTEFFASNVATFSCLLSQSQMIIPDRFNREEEILASLNNDEATVLFITRDNLVRLLTFMDDNTKAPRSLRTVLVDMDLNDDDVEDVVALTKQKLGATNVHVSVSTNRSLLSIDDHIVPEVKIVAASGRPTIVHKNTYGSLKMAGPTVAPFVWNELGALPTKDEDGFVTSHGVFKMNDDNSIAV